MTTADFYILAEPRRFDRRLKEERARVATEQSSLSQPKVEAEPETRLWKVCAEAASPRLSRCEWIAILVFGGLGPRSDGLLHFRVVPVIQQRCARPNGSRAPN